MRVVSRMTGLTAHTIRVWERRYQAITPQRTEGNTRRYSAADVRRLSLLRQATSRGYQISDMAQLPEDELIDLVAEKSQLAAEAGGGDDELFERLNRDYLLAVERFDVGRSAEILARAAGLLDRDSFVFRVVLPILRETGDRWYREEFSVSHEHLVTAQVRGLLDSLLRLSPVPPGAPSMVIATPAGHLHEFGALVGALLAASRGLGPVYLGPDIPTADLAVALREGRADVLLLGVLRDMSSDELATFDHDLVALGATAEVWVGTSADHDVVGRVPGVRYFTRFEDLDLALTERAQAASGAA